MRQVSHFNIRTTLQTHCAIRMKLTVASRLFIYLPACFRFNSFIYAVYSFLQFFFLLLAHKQPNKRPTNMHCTRVVCLLETYICFTLSLSSFHELNLTLLLLLYIPGRRSVSLSLSLLLNVPVSGCAYSLLHTFCSK